MSTAIVLVTGAGGVGKTTVSAAAGVTAARSGVPQVIVPHLLDQYYWYDRVPSRIDYAAFPTPEATLDYLRYDTLDRFSYITSQTAFDTTPARSV